MGARCGDYGGEEPSLVDTHWPLSWYHGAQCRTTLHNVFHIGLNTALDTEFDTLLFFFYIVSVLGQDKGYTVNYNALPEGVIEEKARGNS